MAKYVWKYSSTVTSGLPATKRLPLQGAFLFYTQIASFWVDKATIIDRFPPTWLMKAQWFENILDLYHLYLCLKIWSDCTTRIASSFGGRIQFTTKRGLNYGKWSGRRNRATPRPILLYLRWFRELRTGKIGSLVAKKVWSFIGSSMGPGMDCVVSTACSSTKAHSSVPEMNRGRGVQDYSDGSSR